MATITITIGNSLNDSLSVGDTAYYAHLGASTITSNQLVPTNKTMLLFSKDAEVNTSGLTGYHATVKMKNSSTTESELFAVSSEVVQSSK